MEKLVNVEEVIAAVKDNKKWSKYMDTTGSLYQLLTARISYVKSLMKLNDLLPGYNGDDDFSLESYKELLSDDQIRLERMSILPIDEYDCIIDEFE